MSKLILFRGGVETLTYFSEQIADYFLHQGWQIFWFNIEDQWNCAKKVKRFIRLGDTYLFTFNFLGLTGEEAVYDDTKGYLWEQYDIPCYNMVVDHPLYYKERYDHLPKKYFQFCIDHEHERYMKTYYPEVVCVGFLPLAGTQLETQQDISDVSSWLKQRPMDVMFAGNYNDLTEYEAYITRINEEYTAFYRGIISELLHHPQKSLTEVARRHCVREMGQMSLEEWRICFQHLNFIDLYIRFYERQQVLKALVENGVKVDVFGHGYEKMDVTHRENLVIHGPVDSLTCLQQMQKAKISLNVMPWFREGAHDRIFNAMANDSVCLTDTSTYISQIFKHQESVLFYDLLQLDGFAQQVKQYLACPEQLFSIAQRGKEITVKEHLWKHRAKCIEQSMKS